MAKEHAKQTSRVIVSPVLSCSTSMFADEAAELAEVRRAGDATAAAVTTTLAGSAASPAGTTGAAVLVFRA